MIKLFNKLIQKLCACILILHMLLFKEVDTSRLALALA
ncbi:hypothetical protein Sterm_2477 [Sebaldella termitidis ATCC 33386]|uniref:Uncharacterized protein n=1 Tax=Sebaldella termitidis (strain ATCC 33386 / NCTC 11300) TaxID=526218 RepID=D1ALI7_SEBTE|nr:hypothetical protein Sterm_2477 [Sebaldella termitidis ATCC 33386]